MTMGFLSVQKYSKSPFLDETIRRLEHITGNDSLDIRYSLDIKNRGVELLQNIGLDPLDSTRDEVNRCLESRMRTASHELAQTLASTDKRAISELDAARIVDLITPCFRYKYAWVVKRSFVKKLIKQVPPTATMAKLHYKSVDSMLKRTPVKNILLECILSEDDNWIKIFSQKIADTTPSDFERRAIECVVSSAHIDDKKDALLMIMGVVAFVGFDAMHPVNVMRKTLELVARVNQCRSQQTYIAQFYALNQFGDHIQRIVEEGKSATKVRIGLNYLYFDELLSKVRLPTKISMFDSELHVLSADDYHYNNISETIHFYCPSFDVFKEIDDVYIQCVDGIVSCSPADIVSGLFTEEPQSAATIDNVICAMLSRYLENPIAAKHLVRQFV